MSLSLSLLAPSQSSAGDIPYDRIKIGPACPTMNGLFLEFQTFDLAMKVSAALDETPSRPKVIMLPTIYVSGKLCVLKLLLLIHTKASLPLSLPPSLFPSLPPSFPSSPSFSLSLPSSLPPSLPPSLSFPPFLTLPPSLTSRKRSP